MYCICSVHSEDLVNQRGYHKDAAVCRQICFIDPMLQATAMSRSPRTGIKLISEYTLEVTEFPACSRIV